MVQQIVRDKSVVAAIRCGSYNEVTVEEAVRRGIDLLGGAGVFASPGEKIVFKPNVLWGTDPARCIVTHPSVLRAVIMQFAGTGATLQYGDSSAGLPNAGQNMRKCGYTTAVEDLPVELVSFEDADEVSCPDGIAGKRLRLSRAALNADGVINLPKLKTHGLVRMTGAVKNCFGCVPGTTKGAYHARFPDVSDFSNLLADIATRIRPRLHILDAVEAMEGNGPQSGTPKNLGILLFSSDPVALDTVACRLIDLNPDFVPTIAAGVRTGLGVSEPRQIEVVGDSFDEPVDRHFNVVRKPPASFPVDGIFRFVKHFFLARPVVRKNSCIHCGHCVEVCPVAPKALRQTDTDKPPEYDYGRCIRCYCCQEICPSKAIHIHTPPVARFLPMMTYLSLLAVRRRTRTTGDKP